MSHLGELLSALIDGELSGTEFDRANAHLAACGTCQADASALRRLKHDLRGLAVVHEPDEITRRLLAMANPADPIHRVDLVAQVPARHLGRALAERGPRGRTTRSASRAGIIEPYPVSSLGKPDGRRRVRYVLWSTLSLVVVGIGSAAFGMGGGSAPAGPRITPQLEVYDIQHALTSGDVPFPEPAVVSARVPVGAAKP